MGRSTEELRVALLDAAEEQLRASPEGEVATRAVCQAVGVTQPVLYRVFGDKRGLLDALAERGLERYTSQKAELEVSDDPVADLQAGWDDHMSFAAANPALYRLMFSPRPWSGAGARERLLGLLEAVLQRCAAAGALRMSPQQAAVLVLSANVGLALNAMAEPDRFAGEAVSHRVRDAVFSAVVRSDPDAAAPAAARRPLPEAAQRLRSQLDVTSSDALSPQEVALLRVWLDRLASTEGSPAETQG